MGGTFDKEYDEIKGELFFKNPHLSKILKMGHYELKVNIKTLMMSDSLEITGGGREIILENCKKKKIKY